MAKYTITNDENGNHYVLLTSTGECVDGPFDTYSEALKAAKKDPAREELVD